MATVRTYTPDELRRMTPQEDQERFDRSVVTDLSQVPPGFLAELQAELLEQLREQRTSTGS